MLVISARTEVFVGHILWVLKNVAVILFTSFCAVKRRPLKDHNNELYSQTPKFGMCRNDFQVLSKECVLTKMLSRYFLKGFLEVVLVSSKVSFAYLLKTCLNYSSRFPEGVHKRKSNNDDKHDHDQEKR